MRLSRTPALVEQRRLPALGEHTEEFLAEFGYAPDEIATLRRDGVI